MLTVSVSHPIYSVGVVLPWSLTAELCCPWGRHSYRSINFKWIESSYFCKVIRKAQNIADTTIYIFFPWVLRSQDIGILFILSFWVDSQILFFRYFMQNDFQHLHWHARWVGRDVFWQRSLKETGLVRLNIVSFQYLLR